MQPIGVDPSTGYGCFYLSKRRQMQRKLSGLLKELVVFTFQKEGRCNYINQNKNKQTVVFTFQKEGRCNFIGLVA